MSEPSEDQDAKTEDPTPRRLDQARQDGDLALGRDAGPVAGLVAGMLALAGLSPGLVEALQRLFSAAATGLAAQDLAVLRPPLASLAGYAAGICAAGALGTAAAVIAQTHGGVWPELAGPKLERISGAALKRLFKGELWADLGLALLKVAIVGWALWGAGRSIAAQIVALVQAPAPSLLDGMLGVVGTVLIRALAAMALVAAADFLLQRARHHKRLKMTREEVRRELKEDEGDPLIRSRRRRRARELAKSRVAQDVPRADVVVVNPTHVAVALRYRKGLDRAPRLLAKGKGRTADFIRQLARENGVPIVQDIPLARLLYRRVKVGASVPEETYRAVAAILAFVYRLTRRERGGAA